MESLYFEVLSDADGKVYLPETLAGKKLGITVQVLEEEQTEREKAWAWLLADMERHQARGMNSNRQPYQWNRDELYDHLDKYGRDEDSSN